MLGEETTRQEQTAEVLKTSAVCSCRFAPDRLKCTRKRRRCTSKEPCPMRSILASTCALLLLSGCGRSSSESPPAAINSSPSGTASQSGKEKPNTTSTQPNPDKKTNVAAAKHEAPSIPDGRPFSENDP